mmetsp:Transcript_106250/g.200045  ORF Transcript_106250/g.200045 Transcript_106250/m.200045 type:complete len:81 (-) Transcript_106250:460-702(-)
MDCSIQDNGEVDVGIIVCIGIQPVDEEDGGMVIDMQEGYLAPVALDNHENSVCKIEYFGEVEYVQHKRHTIFSEIVGIAH